MYLKLLRKIREPGAPPAPGRKSSEFARPRARKLACQAGLRVWVEAAHQALRLRANPAGRVGARVLPFRAIADPSLSILQRGLDHPVTRSCRFGTVLDMSAGREDRSGLIRFDSVKARCYRSGPFATPLDDRGELAVGEGIGIRTCPSVPISPTISAGPAPTATEPVWPLATAARSLRTVVVEAASGSGRPSAASEPDGLGPERSTPPVPTAPTTRPFACARKDSRPSCGSSSAANFCGFNVGGASITFATSWCSRRFGAG